MAGGESGNDLASIFRARAVFMKSWKAASTPSVSFVDIVGLREVLVGVRSSQWIHSFISVSVFKKSETSSTIAFPYFVSFIAIES